MAVSSFKRSLFTSNPDRYDSFLAGNNAYIPNSFESIATATPTTGASITFSSIPSTYKHLQLRIIGRSDDATNNVALYIQPNSATGSVYTLHELYGDGASIVASGYGTGTYLDGAYTEVFGSFVAANTMGVSITDFIDYASTTKTKTMRIFSGADRNGNGHVELKSSLWTSTNAITSIKVAMLSGNFVSGTVISLYGIKG